VHPILQDHFAPDYQTMLDTLRQQLNACDAVVCLVGFVHGREPKTRPEGASRRSYSQLEFDLAEAFDKRLYVFLATEQCPFDSPQTSRRSCASGSRHTANGSGSARTSVAAVCRWLEEHNGWLLILDNVDSEDAAQAIEHLLPRLQRGHALLTSRLTHWHGAEPLALDVLAEADVVAFLLERTAGFRSVTPQDEAATLALARELGGLALALEQAGAYIQHLHCALSEYLERWRRQEARVREWFDARLMQYPRSVAVTWETTLTQLDASARALLQLLAWLAPDPH
jgi:hypothetical protein